MSVNPDPSSCSSDQVSPSEDYCCSGLVLGTRYTFTVSAINCGDQEGERESFIVNITMNGKHILTSIQKVCCYPTCAYACALYRRSTIFHCHLIFVVRGKNEN